MSRNPFERAERIGRRVTLGVLCVMAAGGFVLLGVAAVNAVGPGWWWLVVIPAVPTALSILGDWAADRWRDAKRRWDETNRDRR